jgi:hypothetical protein
MECPHCNGWIFDLPTAPESDPSGFPCPLCGAFIADYDLPGEEPPADDETD